MLLGIGIAIILLSIASILAGVNHQDLFTLFDNLIRKKP